ncbi:MAG: hypothetical protein GY814_11335 [Gammaproteobacteria bacterium]|nr:hypothetical protein [Gammaproteobacteria bacterium]
MEKLLVARRNGNELILGYIDAQDKNLGFCTQFQNIRLDGPLAPVGVLSCPLDSYCWDTLTFYGAAFMQRKLPPAVTEQLKTIVNDNGISLWQATNSYYKAYEFLLSIGITPIIIDKWSDIHITGIDGSLTELRGPVVCNVPLLNKKDVVHSYLQNKIREELETIRVKEKTFSEEQIMKLFKNYL